MEELTINHIDYDFVDKCENPKLLRKAIKLLKEDGGYYKELEKYVEEKLKTLDKTFRAQHTPLSQEEINRYTDDIKQWENEIKKSDKLLNSQGNNEIFNENKTKNIDADLIEKKKIAENEKLKGNELMKTKEYDQAIKLYSSSIKIDPLEPTTYCNRALAYSKIKQYDNAINDCTKAVSLKDDYTKAFYRRAVCFIAVNKFKEAFTDLLIVLRDTPDSQEVMDELKNLKEKWSNHLGKAEYEKIQRVIEEEIEMAKKRVKKTEVGFKKIKIIEEPENKELIEKFKNFLNSGPLVKKQLDDLIEESKFSQAEDTAREKLGETQNLMKEFPQNTKEYSQLENVVSDINTMIDIIKKKSNSETKPLEKGKYYKTKILSEDIRENATKIAETDLNFNDFPISAIGFEKAFNSLKNKNSSFFRFLNHFGNKNLEISYNKNELSYQLLSGIIKCFKECGLDNNESATITVEYLKSISRTKNFSLIKKFLKKSDKEDLNYIFNNLKENYKELIFSLELDKLFL